MSGEEITEVFMKTNCKKLVKKNLEQKKYLKKGDKLYVKWKWYNNRFNSWINKKRSHTCLKDICCKQRIKMSHYFPKPLEVLEEI